MRAKRASKGDGPRRCNLGPFILRGVSLLGDCFAGRPLSVGLTPLGRPKVCAPQAAVAGYPGC